MEGRLRILGANHPDTVSTLNELSKLYGDWGKPEKAVEWKQRLQSASRASGQN
jgi:hypothetical protein